MSNRLPNLDEEYEQLLLDAAKISIKDPEQGHANADKLLVELLLLAGYNKSVIAYEKVRKFF